MKSKFNFIIIIAIFLFIALIFRYSPSIGNKTINEDIQLNNQQEKEEGLGVDYNCETLTQEEIQISFDSTTVDKLGNSILSLRKDISIINNNISLNGLCEYNLKTGQKASGFSCEGSYIIENKQISDDGIIQEKNPKTITYAMSFDDNSCEITQGAGLRGILKCKVLSATCKWNYGKPSKDYMFHIEQI